MAKEAKRPAESPPGPAMLPSFDPASGTVTGEFASSSPAEVRTAVERARRAAGPWGALPVRERARTVARLRTRIHERMDEIVETVSQENGKPAAEALAHDVVPSLVTLAYLEQIAPRALRSRPVGRLMGPVLGTTSRIDWRPFGVVGCIAPWNYPFFLSMMAVTPALLAGNAVVLKPSEMTPGVGERLREVLDVLPPGVATVVQGAGEVGAALVDAPCDKLCFIGSTATGRTIAEAAARHLTPVVMELGGQDAAIVAEDADLDIASSGVLWGAFLNAGQTCCAIERAYVVESIADRFEHQLLEKLAKVSRGPGGDIGPLTVPRQLQTVRGHVDDAVGKGAAVLTGGAGRSGGNGDGGLWYEPTVLEGRSEDMDLFREETFGPVLPIVRVRDVDEAVRRANEDGYNLTASVWTRSPETARTVASRLVAGTVTVNDHAITASAPWGAWGGVGESGYGRLHGELGLREFAVPVHVSRNLTPWLKRPWWYPYDEATTRVLRGVADLLSTPSWAEKRRAVGQIAANLGRSIKDKL
jgi:succinate-semialdehyde dehydrogenase/glutarate-semialdehyde dehydrogenase